VIDKWREQQEDKPSKAEAIRRLVELGLKAKKMTKTPGQFEPPKLITKAEREAQKAFRKDDAKKAMTEHEIEQKAFSTNRERLKAERRGRPLRGRCSTPRQSFPTIRRSTTCDSLGGSEQPWQRWVGKPSVKFARLQTQRC
jgi:hypothetical protein